jgi:hypothetical protein
MKPYNGICPQTYMNIKGSREQVKKPDLLGGN